MFGSSSFSVVISAHEFVAVGLLMFTLGLIGGPFVWRLVLPPTPERPEVDRLSALVRTLHSDLSEAYAQVESSHEHADRLLTDPAYYRRQLQLDKRIEAELTFNTPFRAEA